MPPSAAHDPAPPVSSQEDRRALGCERLGSMRVREHGRRRRGAVLSCSIERTLATEAATGRSRSWLPAGGGAGPVDDLASAGGRRRGGGGARQDSPTTAAGSRFASVGLEVRRSSRSRPPLRRAAWRGRAITMDEAAWGRLADSVPSRPPRCRGDARAPRRRCSGRSPTTSRPSSERCSSAIVVLEVPVDVAGRPSRHHARR